MAEPNDKPKKLSMGSVMSDPKFQPPVRRVPHYLRDGLDIEHDAYHGSPFRMTEEDYLGYTPGDQ